MTVSLILKNSEGDSVSSFGKLQPCLNDLAVEVWFLISLCSWQNTFGEFDLCTLKVEKSCLHATLEGSSFSVVFQIVFFLFFQTDCGNRADVCLLRILVE